MPSPFPGMDPYLEGSMWTSVHFTLCGEIQRQLAVKVPIRYLVLPAERFVLEVPDQIAVTTAGFYPDVALATERPAVSGRRTTAVVAAPLEIATVVPSRVPHVTIEIRDASSRDLVTAIEVLSPTNKRGEGREEYLTKRRRILISPAHLLEIDLLREGERVPMQKPLPPAPYFVILSRSERRPIAEVWPIPLDGRLPVVPVPLLHPDPDVPLDLQAALEASCGLLGSSRAIDYSGPPERPLPGEAAAWAEERLKAAGLRV